MKTKSLFFAVLIAVSASAFAGEDEPGMTVVPVKGSEVFKVIYRGGSAGRVWLHVYDPQGNRIHSERIQGLNGFICPLNFKGLAPGSYRIEIIDEKVRYQEEISFRKPVREKSIHVSKLQGAEGKYLLAIANVRNEPIHVAIYDSGNRMIFSETRDLDADFAQVYRLPYPNRGYTFEISDKAGQRKHFSF